MGRIPVPPPRIAKWNGLGELKISDDGNIYVGGDFTDTNYYPEYTINEHLKCQHCGQYGDWRKPCEYCGAPVK
jgi:hypothetical protein